MREAVSSSDALEAGSAARSTVEDAGGIQSSASLAHTPGPVDPSTFLQPTSYTEWAATHASDVNGDGWGSDHLWHYESTPTRTSYYKCSRCMWPFAHHYPSEPNIFTAMRDAGVPNKCARQQLWPVRYEYAKPEEREYWERLRAAIAKATGSAA